jgi:hypothetical protein
MRASWRSKTTARRCFPAAGTLLLTALLAGCGSSSGPSYFLITTPSEVVVVSWPTPQNGQASGTITDVATSGTAPSETVDVTTVPASVTVNGSQVTVRASGPFSTAPNIPGTLKGSTLTLTPTNSNGQIVTLTLQSSDVTAYNQAAAKLRQDIADVNVSTGVRQLGTDSGGLASAVGSLASDMQRVKADLASEQSAATAAGPANACSITGTSYGTITDDATTVDDTDNNAVGSDVNTLTGDISTVRLDISQLRSDTATLQHFGGKPAAGAQAAISRADSDIASTASQANTDIRTVNGYLQQAYTVANSTLSSCGGFPNPPSLEPLIPA